MDRLIDMGVALLDNSHDREETDNVNYFSLFLSKQ